MSRVIQIDWKELRARLPGLPRLPELPGGASRWPVLTLGLCAVLLVALLVVEIGYARRLAEARNDVAAAVDFAIHNPVVAIHPRLMPAVRALIPDFEGNETFAFLRDSDRADAAKTTQDQFDQLSVLALSEIDSHPYRTLGLVPSRANALGFAFHSLVHPGWLHGLATIALLMLLAPLLERTWGAPVLGAVLLLAMLVGSLAYVGVYWGSERPLLGSSAWVSAVAAACLARFRGSDIDPLYWVPVGPSLRAPFWSAGALWLVYEALAASSAGGGLPGGFDAAPTWPADLAAAGVGALAALVLQRFGVESRLGGNAPLPPPRRRTASRFDMERVQALRANGHTERAYALLQEEATRSARNRDAVVTFFEMAVERGTPDDALPAMCRLIPEELRRGAAAVAVSHWRAICEAVERPSLAPELLVRLIPVILEEYGEEMAVVALRQAAAPEHGKPAPELAREVAALAADLDPETAAGAAKRALEASNLAAEERARLERLVARGAREREAARGLELPEDVLPVREKREKKAPPKNVFYEEQDRSAFGEVGGEMGELMAPGEEEVLYSSQPAPEAPAPQASPPEPQPAPPVPEALPPEPEPTPPVPEALPPEPEPTPPASQAAPSPTPAPRTPAPKASAPPPVVPTVLDVTDAVPLSLGPESLVIRVKGRGRAQIPFAHLHAVAMAGVRGLASRPVVLIDLLVTGPKPTGHPRRIVRLRSDTFDPTPFAPDGRSPLAALRELASEIAQRGGAELLVAPDAPLQTFDCLDAYVLDLLTPHL